MLVFVASPRMDIRCRSKGKRVGIKRSVGRLWRLCGGMVVGVVLSAAAGASARPGVDHPVAESGSVAADPIAKRHSGIRRRAKKKR